jgi:hypothetical protein
MLQSVGLAAVVTTVVLFALLVPPAHYFELRSDTFSAPYAMALAGFGALAILMPLFVPDSGRQIAGGLAFAGLGLAVLFVIVWLYPALLNGPFPMITGLAKTNWFDRIHQEMPITVFFQIRDYRAIGFAAAMLMTLVLAVPAAWRSARAGHAAIPAIVTLGLTVVAMTMVSSRTLRLALAIVPLLLPIAIAVARDAIAARVSRAGQATALVAATSIVLAAFLLLFRVVPKDTLAFDAYDFLLMNDCKAADYSAFADLGAARVMAPPALGLKIIGMGFDGVSVSTVIFHRAAPGINRLLATFRSGDTGERAEYLKDFDYLAVCKSPTGLPAESELPVFSDLMAGRTVPGLVPMPGNGEILLFRIDHSPKR